MRRFRRIALALAIIAACSPAASAAAAPPDNDAFANAKVILANPFGDTLDTTEATLEAVDDEAAAACNATPGDYSHTVWYAYTPVTDRTVRITTDTSSYGVGGAIVTGSPGALAAIPGGCFLGGTTVDLTAGTTYHIGFAQSGPGSGGTLRIILADYVPPQVALSVDGSGRFTRAGNATVGGSASCTAGAFASAYVTVTQSVGRVSTVTGGSYLELPCDGNARPWSATVVPGSGLFRGGRATVTVYTYICDGTGCFDGQTTRTVALSGK